MSGQPAARGRWPGGRSALLLAGVLLALGVAYRFSVSPPKPGSLAVDAGSSPDAAVGGQVELQTRSTPDGRVTAHWWGVPPETEEGSPVPPLEYGVEELWFSFEGDPRRYPFKPRGSLYFSDWRFDIFSPDGAHVLLLQDRFGPYHVVATQNLRAYLTGQAPPDEVVAHWPSPPGGFVPVHANARWLSPTEFEFEAQSETPERIRHSLGKR